MVANPIHDKWTVEEYLAFEEESEIRHEFVDGQIYAMAGASENHNELTNTISAFILQQKLDGSCRVYQSDMMVQAANEKLYYPDVLVVCGERQYRDEKRRTLLNPTIIIEVLSPSTESKDRGQKFADYRTIPSLQEYWLFSQDRVQVEYYVRKSEKTWEFGEITDPDVVLELSSIGCTLALRDIYRRVEFGVDD